MGFIPDPYSATVRIGARWRDGKFTTLDDKPIPKIQEGTFVELVIPARALANHNERVKLRSKRIVEMLPAEARVWLGLSTKAVPPELHKKFLKVRTGSAACYLLAEVILLEPLLITVDGSERATLNECRCGIFMMDTDARSLNHALTLLSQEFEPDRVSHTGNVFRQGFTFQGKRCLALDDLRLARVMKALQEISDAPTGENLPCLIG